MKNVKVILIGVALCATVFANARIEALGGDAGFWAGYRANAAIFPGTLNDANWIEFGGVEGATGEDEGTNGFTGSINWGDDTKWGLNFNVSEDCTAGDGDTFDCTSNNNDWVNMSWAKDGMGLAVGFQSTAAGDDESGTDISGFDVAWGSTLSFGEIGVGYISTDDATAANETELWANWRGDMGFWVFDQAKANFWMGDDDMSLDFDLFTHITPADGVDILVGWGFGYETTNAGEGTTMWLPSATLAAEAAMTDWATVRGFVSQNYALSCDTGAENGDCGSGNTTDYGFGVGFGWQAASGSSVNLDMEVSNNLFVDPISTMGGWDDDDLANGTVTLSYTF